MYRVWSNKFREFFKEIEKRNDHGTGNTATAGIQDEDNEVLVDGCCIACEQATENFHGLCDDCNASMEYALQESKKYMQGLKKKDDHLEEIVDDTTSAVESLITLKNKVSKQEEDIDDCHEDSTRSSQQTTSTVDSSNTAEATYSQKIVTDNNLICPLGKYFSSSFHYAISYAFFVLHVVIFLYKGATLSVINDNTTMITYAPDVTVELSAVLLRQHTLSPNVGYSLYIATGGTLAQHFKNVFKFTYVDSMAVTKTTRGKENPTATNTLHKYMVFKGNGSSSLVFLGVLIKKSAYNSATANSVYGKSVGLFYYHTEKSIKTHEKPLEFLQKGDYRNIEHNYTAQETKAWNDSLDEFLVAGKYMYIRDITLQASEKRHLTNLVSHL